MPRTQRRVDLADVHAARVARRDDRLHTLTAPVVRDGQDRALGVLVALDAAEVKELILFEGTSEVASEAVVVVRGRRVEKHRFAARKPPGERRAIELRVAVEP